MSALGLERGTEHDWETLWSQPGLERRTGHNWETLWSQPGLERRTYHDEETFFSTRDGTEVCSSYKGKYFARVFNLCKGGILPYKGIGIQYLEKWQREIIM